ncbi:MAG: TIGR04255 family protein [Acidobacteriia bacterium]|nr:TIGR04255 family protein [Terriglobia bacterium]
MAFPSSQRVIYQKNPLNQVVCQLRFPPILKIEAELPSVFQEAVRSDYPLFSEAQPLNLPFPQDAAKMVRIGLQIKVARQYEFVSADQVWKLSLSKDAIALGCSDYKRWEQFRTRFVGPFEALVAVYGPSFFQRAGLRYINLIQRSRLGLTGVGWNELIQSYIAPEMETQIANALDDTEHTLIVRLNENSRVRIYHGIARIADGAEEGYLIDNDFFTEQRVEVKDVVQRLDTFNRSSGDLFRWCIAERLHRAMEPTPVESQAPVS